VQSWPDNPLGVVQADLVSVAFSLVAAEHRHLSITPTLKAPPVTVPHANFLFARHLLKFVRLDLVLIHSFLHNHKLFIQAMMNRMEELNAMTLNSVSAQMGHRPPYYAEQIQHST
jgi:hypothetical protein